MNLKLIIWRGALASALLLSEVCPALRAQNAVEPPAAPSEELPAGAQVLTGGPVHEAFAKPVSIDAQTPVLAPQPPPENLQELPPAERPAGADIVWVPGYWAWDADRQDFVWVSGCWRNAPPNTYWVPGYWMQVGNSWEWIGGFWKPVTAQPQQEIEYLPAPPAPIEVEAPGAPPIPDQIWVPGCWYWVQGRYVHRHGYWIAPHVGWVWVPSHLVWTPRGYIFAAGHWDHDMDNRGVLFCPTYFPHEVRVRPGFVFSPAVCVDLGMLRINLFVYPQYHHYYFGDYYDDAYVHAGIFPWFRCQTIHTWYDPLFVYDRWHFRRTDPHWAANQVHQYDYYRSHKELRPAHTYTELQAQMTRLPANRRPERPLVAPIRTYATSQHTPVKFERVDNAERQQIAQRANDVHTLRDQRTQWEAPATAHRTTPEPAKPEHRPGTTVSAKPEPKPAPAPPARASKPGPQQPVRVTQPERVTVPTLPRTPSPAESRFIEKVPPGHPTQEQSRVAPGAKLETGHNNPPSASKQERKQ